MEDKNARKVRDFEAKSAVSIFGAPISWVALIGALTGAMAMVPFIFYPLGGGYVSAGTGIFGPLAGILLGPWAGFVAGAIGGIIGGIISPAAYPLGFIDMILTGAVPCLCWGLMQPKYRKIALPFFIIIMIVAVLVPYHIPGARFGFDAAPEPKYALSWNASWIGLIMYIFFAPRIWRFMESEKVGTSIIGWALNMFMAAGMFILPWYFIYWAFLKLPVDAAILSNYFSWLLGIAGLCGASTIIGYTLIRALKRAGLRLIPGSYLANFDFKAF